MPDCSVCQQDMDLEELLQEHKHLLFTNFKKLAARPVKD
jgi:hypothetical protein